MRKEKRGIKSVFLGSLAVLAVSLLVAHFIREALAEKSGSSPESGVDSRLTTMATTLETLGYGSTAAGSWGDWGGYLNRVYSAAREPFNDAKAKGLKNGGGTSILNCPADKSDPRCFPQSLGGVDDSDNNTMSGGYGVIPTDAYKQTWVACDGDNNYCGLGNADGNIAEKMDPNTGLIWSTRISSSANWFTANNCQQPSNGIEPKGPNACSANGDVGCICTKLETGETGCEARAENGGGWRLPYQKELMQAYVDGSWGYLSNANALYWSGTTVSNGTQYAWYTNLSYGYTYTTTKPNNLSVRCVR